MKRGTAPEPSGSAAAITVTSCKQLDYSNLTTTHIGFATIQESMDLNNEMDEFIKNHQKWKAEYAERQKTLQEKLAHAPPVPVPVKKVPDEASEQMRKELWEVSKRCGADIKELESTKSKMLEMQRQKAEIDKKLQLSQKALENKGEVQKLVSPLDELQSQLNFEADELAEILKPDKKANSGTTAVAAPAAAKTESEKADPKVAKILADLDQDMKELDELLK